MFIIFWLIFFAVIACLFFANRELILRNISLLRETAGDAVSGGGADSGGGAASETPAPEVPSSPPPAERPPGPAAKPVDTAPPVETPKPSAAPKPASAPAGSAKPGSAPQPVDPAKGGTAEAGRSRALYFMQVDRDGTIVRTKVSKTLPASDSPMLDALKALIQGPQAEDQKKGLISLIPQGTRVLNATVRGETAYISFSEDFQYNTYGVEGYAAQLRQIVWTATEFSNVKDVQILIEGRRIDYLGESVWIGSPLSRNML